MPINPLTAPTHRPQDAPRTPILHQYSHTLLDSSHSNSIVYTYHPRMRSFYNLLGLDDDHYALPYLTSWAFGPGLLAIIRLLISSYAFVVIFVTYGVRPASIGHSFSYFTELSYWGIAFYTLVAGAHGVVYALRGRTWLGSWPRLLQALHGFYYTTIVTFPFLVTIVYWSILSPNPWYPVGVDRWRDVSLPDAPSLVSGEDAATSIQPADRRGPCAGLTVY
jgi:hypothetical protein